MSPRFPPLLALPCALVACFAESSPPLSGPSDGDPSSDAMSSSEASDATSSADGSDTSGTATSSPTTSASATTTTASDDDASTTDPSSAGTTGACGEDCATFAGAHSEILFCGEDCPAAAYLPSLGGCDCGDFDAFAPMPVMTDTCSLPAKGLPDVDAVLHLCERPDLEFDDRRDFGGAFLRAEGDGCDGVMPGACMVENPRRDNCTCGNAIAVEIGVWASCGDDDIGTRAPATLTICVDVEQPIVTFGGVYLLTDDPEGSPECTIANARVPTECACPDGTEPEALRLSLGDGGHGSLVFCMAS